MESLTDQSCRNLRGPEHLVPSEALPALLAQVPAWEIEADRRSIARKVRSESFPACIELVQRVANLAEAENHHPDMDVRFRNLRLALSTHDCGGLTLNDFILAAKIDALV